MQNNRFFARKFFRRLSILLITFGFIVVVASRPLKNGPHPAVSEIEAYDTPGIVIDPVIRDSFPCIYDLLERLISEKKGIFRERAFHAFFASPATRLVFSEKALSKDTGAFSPRARFHEDGYFYDTIFLNKSLFGDISQEYLVGLVVHESVHAYLTWCSVCYASDRNGVDDKYLRDHFRRDWDWLTKKPYPNNKSQHMLMTENFIETMTDDLYLYTNANSNWEQRNAVTQALTWAGLNDTPDWLRLGADTCRFLSIDIWSRSLNANKREAGMRPVVKLDGCRTTDTTFLDSLHLKSLCK